MTLQTYSRSRFSFEFPLWAKISMVSLTMLVAGLEMAKHFYRYEWVGWLSFGLYYLVYLPKPVEESTRQYFCRSRTIAAGVLLLVAVAGFLRNIFFVLINQN